MSMLAVLVVAAGNVLRIRIRPRSLYVGVRCLKIETRKEHLFVLLDFSFFFRIRKALFRARLLRRCFFPLYMDIDMEFSTSSFNFFLLVDNYDATCEMISSRVRAIGNFFEFFFIVTGILTILLLRLFRNSQ